MVAALLDGRKHRGRERGDDGLRNNGRDLCAFVSDGDQCPTQFGCAFGKYRLRAVVQESMEGKMASSSLNIEVK
jgi:hypothetical protein